MAEYGPESFLCRDGRELVLRNMLPEDAAGYPLFCGKIAAETRHTLRHPGQIHDPDLWAARWAQDLISDKNLSIGAFFGDVLAGQLGVRCDFPDNPWARHIGSFGMMIVRDFWDQGLGRRLIGLMDAHAQRTGLTRLEATVRTENSRAVRMYRNAGFAIEGTRSRAALIDGKYLDEFHIAKLL